MVIHNVVSAIELHLYILSERNLNDLPLPWDETHLPS